MTDEPKILGSSGPDPFGHPVPEGAAKKVSEVLGELTWLLSQSPIHKQLFISDLEWLIMPPVLLQQFRTYYASDRPLGVVLWALVDDEVDAKLRDGLPKLRPQDWRSGEHVWVFEVIAPFGGADEMVKDLKEKVFADREVSIVRVEDGRRVVRAV